tara:strand:- start:1740 stop:2549 length:810 start_codon:yes stop_codon:yes gene_type:complete
MKLKNYLLLSIIPLIGISSCSRSNVNSLEPITNNDESSKVIKSLTRELKALTKEVKKLKLNDKDPSQTLDSESAKNNIYCADNLNSSVTRISKGILPEGYSDLEDYQLTSDFRRPGKKFPFSEALTYNDPVTGESVAVRDQNFVPGGSKVSSVWARDSIRLGGYWVFSHTVGFTTYFSMYPFEANILWIPDGDNFLVVKGCNGVFKVTKDIAAALLKADDSKNSYIRFSTEGTGSAHLSEIGQGTVSSWKKVYANWNPAPNVKIEDLGF